MSDLYKTACRCNYCDPAFKIRKKSGNKPYTAREMSKSVIIRRIFNTA